MKKEFRIVNVMDQGVKKGVAIQTRGKNWETRTYYDFAEIEKFNTSAVVVLNDISGKIAEMLNFGYKGSFPVNIEKSKLYE